MLREDAIQTLETYSKTFPEENIEKILTFVMNNSTSISRKNLMAHLTASGIVIKDEKILLIFNKNLGRFLQPGGHLENDDSLRGAAKREIFEETGLKVAPSPIFPINIPINIDAHIIPANPNKNEPEHWHYDCCYLFTTDDKDVVIADQEVDGYQWVPLAHKFDSTGLANAVSKINKLLA